MEISLAVRSCQRNELHYYYYYAGVIEARTPTIYDESSARYEMKYLGSPSGTELAMWGDGLARLSRFERGVASVNELQLVSGTVTRHEAYGFYVDIGEDQEGLVVITMISDDQTLPNAPFPPVGREVQAVLLGRTAIGAQPRLSVRPCDLRAVTGP